MNDKYWNSMLEILGGDNPTYRTDRAIRPDGDILETTYNPKNTEDVSFKIVRRKKCLIL